jgi:hypothetical protein
MSLIDQKMLKPAAIGGVVAGVASAIPLLSCLNCACCALVIGGGILAAYLYFQEQPASPEPRYGDGALLGAITGVIAAVASTIVQIPFQLLTSTLGFSPGKAEMEEILSNPEIPPFAKSMLGTMMGGGFSVVAILLGLAVSLVVFGIFALIGGVIGAALFDKKRGLPPAAPGGSWPAPAAPVAGSPSWPPAPPTMAPPLAPDEPSWPPPPPEKPRE